MADTIRETPLVSVVVPFFNSERHLAACIESLLGQENVGGPFEILLVNNGSKDSSPSIAGRYSGLTVLEESTPGAYAARNTGVQQAQAPLIAFTDADCVVAKDWLRALQDGMRDPSIAILLGHFRYPAQASSVLRLLGAYENAKTEYVINHCDPAHHFGYANNMAVRATVFENLGPFKEWKRAADSELIHRLASAQPDLRLAYSRSMRVTHMEFLQARTRVRRLSLYTHTNSKIKTFQELRFRQRLGLLWHLVRGHSRTSS